MPPVGSQEVFERLRAYFLSNPDLTAVYLSDDHFCPLVFDALSSLGKSVPDEISVFSYANKGDAPVWRKEVSRIEIDHYIYGKTSAEALMGLVEGDTPSGCTQSLSPELVPGETVRPLSVQHDTSGIA